MNACEEQQSDGSGEERVFLEKRPTCVTVIGWVWIIVGSMVCLTVMVSVSVLFSGLVGLTATTQDRLLQAGLYGLLLASQTALGILSISGGINLLKLKSWARKLLLVLCWIVLVLLVAQAVMAACVGIHDIAKGERVLPVVGMLVSLLVMQGALCAGFVIMLRYLRGDRVKDAMQGGGEPAGEGESRMDSDAHSSAAHD